MAERTLAILVTAKNLASKALRGVSQDLDKLGNRASKGLGTAAKNVGTLAIATAGLATVLTVGAVKAAGDFESQLNTINTVAARTPAELDKIGQGIRQIARDTGTPLEELTQGFYDLVSAGVAADQAQRVLTSSNRLAIGGLSTAAEGVDLLTTALNSYGVSAANQGAESERFADIFAKSIERGKVTAAELAASFAKVGGLAANNKIEVEELAAGYAQLTSKGMPAAEAATAMSSAMIALIRRTGDLEKLEKTTGKSYLAIAGKKGLVAALEELRVDSAKTKKPLIDFLGRQEALALAVNATGDNFASYNTNLAAMNDANGTAARQMSERQQGLNFQIARLKALALDAGITIGSKLLPKLTPLAERLVSFLASNQGAIESFGDDLASAFDDAAAFAQRIPWEQVGSGLKIAAEWAGKLMGVFMAMPPEAQAAIVALAGLNKLSGGAVSGIAGELGKGLIKGVLGMNAGVVNINAATVNGAGGMGGAGGSAGLMGILRASLVGGTILAIGLAVGSAVTDAMGGPTAGTKDAGKGRDVGNFLGIDWTFGRHEGDLVRQENERRQNRNRSMSPDERQARNDQAKLGLAVQRAGEWGGAAISAIAKEQSAVERFRQSASPSLASMKAHLSILEGLQRSTPARDAGNAAAIIAAIRAIKLQMPAMPTPVVTVSVPVRTVTINEIRWNRVANRPPRSGPTID